METPENLEALFDSKGYTNSLQADFFLKLGTHAHIEQERFPVNLPKPAIPNSEEFNNAYSLVINYLNDKKMTKTIQMTQVYNPSFQPKSTDTLNTDFKLPNNSNTLLELIHKQRIKTLLNTDNLDACFQ